MRTIKFRGRCLNNGWREDGRFKDGEWVYGSYISRRSGTYIEFQDAPKSKSLHGATHCVKVDPETVEQYTGLKDKNGVEIYEGDILRSDRYPFSNLEDGDKDNYYAVVQWCEEEACFAAFYEVSAHAKVRGISAGMNIMDFSDVCFMELVGNIHDNPSLLKGGEV